MKLLYMNDGTKVQYNYFKNSISYFIKTEENIKIRYIIIYKRNLEYNLDWKHIDEFEEGSEEYSSADYIWEY